MSSLLLPDTVALLAHKRLVDLVETLERKMTSGLFDVGFGSGSAPIRAQPTDRRVLGLAREARAMFEAGPAVDAPARLRVGPRIGKLALAGALGLELPTYADLLAPGGAWRTDAIRRGTPDPNLSRVLVGTSQLAVRTGELGLGHATTDDERARIRAFTMGLLSAVAHDVVVDPVLRGLQAQRTKRDWTRHSPAVDITAAESRVLADVLGGPAPGAMWQAWLPGDKELPAPLLQGLAEAIEEIYKLDASRPKGFADFEATFDAGDPLTAERLRDAWALLRGDASASAWSWPAWWGILTPVVLMPSLGLIVARALPHASGFFSRAGTVDEHAVWEVLLTGLGLGSVTPFVYSMLLWSQIPEHAEAFVNALLLFVARLALVIASIAEDGASSGVRWLLLAPLLGADVYAAIRAIVGKAKGRPGVAFVFLLNTLPALTAAALLLFSGLMKGVGVDSDLAFWLLWALLTAIMLTAVAIPVAVALSHSGGFTSFFLRDRPDGLPLLSALTSAARPAEPAAPALVFDDSTLWPAAGVDAPTLADLSYPAGRRVLARLWWAGAGGLAVSTQGRTVTFRRDDSTTVQVVLPPGKLTAAAVVASLKAAVAGLEAEVPAPAGGGADPLYDLPYPRTLADPGDTQPTLADHDAHAGDFTPLGTSRDHAFLLLHTPRVELATALGLAGASASALDAIALVPEAGLGNLEQTALGNAADLAVLLALGAVPSLKNAVSAVNSPGLAPLPGNLGPVYQVFRRWNLDERRANEWRMIVAGGAESEKAGDARHADPGMRPPPPAPPYESHADAGEPLTNLMGWLPAWRAWARVAGDLTADTLAPAAMPYTPAVATRDGHVFKPTNAQLTDAVRFLLDLA